ncbi:hypothetical protein AKO1_002514 [Acrasis kona]|uniref:Uncharacterized protein n=1 Tax=Acrasis kona TaxID=1008807 RepID=A0AAW2ZMX5_9EUKA
MHNLDFVKIQDADGKEGSFPREGLCLNRLEVIGKFFHKIVQLGSPTKKQPNPNWVFTPKKQHVLVKTPAKPSSSGETKAVIQPPKKKVIKNRGKQTSIKSFVEKKAIDVENDPIEQFSDEEKKTVTKRKRKRTSATRDADEKPSSSAAGEAETHQPDVKKVKINHIVSGAHSEQDVPHIPHKKTSLTTEEATTTAPPPVQKDTTTTTTDVQ